MTAETLFWAAAAVVAYAYLGYPLLMAVLARVCPARAVGGEPPGSFSVVLCVHNEAGRVGERLNELARLVDHSGRDGEVILVSDGSTDGTADLARACAGGRVRVLELPEKVGKAAAQAAGVAAARGDVLVFCDVRQRWAPDALDRLLGNFADPRVGAASGELVLESAPGVLAGVGLYWKYEKWLRHNEGRAWSLTGVTGAICAARRGLFTPAPPGTILDDVYWPLRVAMRGYRVVHDRSAVAYDRLPDSAAGEFKRKVRTLSGNFQLLTRLPSAVLPWRNPVAAQFVSHKLLRLAVPWLLVVMLTCAALAGGGPYRVLFAAQLAGYLAGVAGLWPAVGRRSRLASAAGSFLVLNAAAALSLWVWATGRAGRSWHKVRYEPPRLTPATPAPLP